MSTVAKVVGGTVAAGTGTGVAGYGTYRYLTYETLRDLIEREKTKDEDLVLLKAEDDGNIWNKAADNYLVSLTGSTESNFINKLSDSITAIVATDKDEDLNNKRKKFKDECLKFLDSEAIEKNQANKDKVKAWCIKFKSFGDKLKSDESKELDLGAGDTEWAAKYTSLTSVDGKVKTLLENKKNGSSATGENAKKTEVAKWWCQLAINKKHDSSKDSEYGSFKDKCPFKAVATGT